MNEPLLRMERPTRRRIRQDEKEKNDEETEEEEEVVGKAQEVGKVRSYYLARTSWLTMQPRHPEPKSWPKREEVVWKTRRYNISTAIYPEKVKRTLYILYQSLNALYI